MKYIQLLENRIINLTDWFVNYNTGTEYNNTIKKFIEKLIKQEIKHPYNYTKIIPPYLLKTDWDKKDYENGTLVRFAPIQGVRSKLEHVINWLRDLPEDQYQSLRGIQNLDIANEHANRYFAAKNKKASDVEDEEGREIVYRFKDGMFFAKLNSSQCLDREGKLMQHCVGSYADQVREGKVVIYSLRDKKNQSHATLEVREKEIFQIKGKQNEAPIEKYIPYIREFILKNDFNIKYDEENIGLIKLNDKLYDMDDTTNWPTHIEKIVFDSQMISLPAQIERINILALRNCVIEFNSEILNVITFKLIDTSVLEWPKVLNIENDLDLYGDTKIHFFGNEVNINGNLVLNKSKILRLPKKLKVSGYLDLRSTNVKLPENLEIGKTLALSRSNIKEIPNNIKIGGSLMLYKTNIEKLGNNIFVGEDLSLFGSPIKELPFGLKIGRNLDIRKTNIKNIPDNLQVEGKILIDSNIKIPKHIQFERL